MSRERIKVRRGRGTQFGQVPAWIARHPDLSDRAVRVFALLWLRSNFDTGEDAYPSRATLAGEARCSVKSIDRAVAELLAAGAIDVHRRKSPKGDWTSNEYVVHSDPPVDNTASAVDEGGDNPASAVENQGGVGTPVSPPSVTGVATGGVTGVARTKALHPEPFEAVEAGAAVDVWIDDQGRAYALDSRAAS